jgi:hypothetical protein
MRDGSGTHYLGDEEYRGAYKALEDKLRSKGEYGIIYWNDRIERTKEEVIWLFDAAIEKLESEIQT